MPRQLGVLISWARARASVLHWFARDEDDDDDDLTYHEELENTNIGCVGRANVAHCAVTITTTTTTHSTAQRCRHKPRITADWRQRCHLPPPRVAAERRRRRSRDSRANYK
jgi:hypothetical protein